MSCERKRKKEKSPDLSFAGIVIAFVCILRFSALQKKEKKRTARFVFNFAKITCLGSCRFCSVLRYRHRASSFAYKLLFALVSK